MTNIKRTKLKTKEHTYNEKQILLDSIEQYIIIANSNQNKFNDYLCIISFINILKEQYPEYSSEFNVYLKEFENKGITKYYYQDDIVYKSYRKYGISPCKANEIKQGYISGCTSRYINFMIAILVCGKPKDSYSRYIMFDIYRWNYTGFYKQRIYYGLKYLKGGLCNDFYNNSLKSKNSHLALIYETLAEAHSKENKKEAEYYHKKAVNFSDIYYKNLILFYKRNYGYDSIINYLKKERVKYFCNFKRSKIISEYLKKYQKEKIGIIEHDFNGYNSIESFYNGSDNPNILEKKYTALKNTYKEFFDKHIERLDRINVIIVANSIKENIEAFMQDVIDDITEFNKIEDFYTKLNSLGLNNEYYYSDNYQKGYLLPKQTIMYLEKNELFKEAIMICDIAIKNNILWDGTKSGIVGRKERLIKKEKKHLTN